MPFLGGDRQASRNELQKLALYVHGRDRITLDDVMAVVADASAVALDNVIDAAFAGKPAEVETHFAKARGEGTHPGVIVSAALRHVASLHRMRIAVEEGQSATGVVEGARPPIHFRRKIGDRHGVAGLDHGKTARRDVVVVRCAIGNPPEAASRRRHRAARR